MKIVRAAVDVLRLAIAREKLGDAEPSPPSRVSPPGPGVLHVIFLSREPLGTEPEPPRRPRRSMLRALFAPEPLPFDPVPAPPPRGRGRLAALFAPEKLDDSR